MPDAVDLFIRLTERPPYNWQRRLLVEHFLKGEIPDAVDIPTGLGKTSVMALWLVALAGGARLPRRLVYVVDRRAVVDQATTEADTLASRLGTGGSGDASLVALRAGLGLRDGQALPVSTLRGQHADNRAWFEDPAAPAIVVGTVDMIGSRLLFSGYGVSPRLRSVHAGLLGADALLVLDEAHLVPPFEGLVRSIQEIRRRTNAPPVPPFRVMSLSATGRTQASAIFGLAPADGDDASVQARLRAGKRVRLLDEVTSKTLPATLADRAWALAQPASAVLVFSDSRKAAQETAALLGTRMRDAHGPAAPAPALLVGERRVYERAALSDHEVYRRFMPRGEAGADAFPETPAFLVATSAGEVGVDLDADHMVCDLVPWERMVQRLGRVNRRPRPAEASFVEVVPVVLDRKRDEAEEEIASERLARLRAPFESPYWPEDAEEWRDASPRALYALKRDDRIAGILAAAQTAEPLRPALTEELIDAWAMTSIDQHTGRPAIQPWLRGWVEDTAQSRMVWRRWLPLRPDVQDEWPRQAVRTEIEAFFDACAPHLTEVLEAPTYRVVDVLRRRADAWLKGRRNETGDGPGHPAVVCVLDDSGELADIITATRLKSEKSEKVFRRLAGRTVIIDARLGGLDPDGLLDPSWDAAPLTIDGEPGSWANIRDTAGFQVRRASADERSGDWRIQYRWRLEADNDSPGASELRVEVWRGNAATRGDPALARHELQLAAHNEHVAKMLQDTTSRLGIDGELSTTLVRAGLVHDSGKSRSLWQRAMNAPPQGGPYAKTRGGGVPAMLRIDGHTYRHEFGSLRDATDRAEIQSMTAELRDLLLHLVASHHGHARPVIAPVDPDLPPSAETGPQMSQEIARRFLRLHRRWGAWGLAWWESLMRAADWRASANPPEMN